MKTTTNNNGTKMTATNNGTTTEQLQAIVLEENVKFSEIPAIYNFENFTIFVESKQTGKTHGDKTTYFGTITDNENGTTTNMDGFDITKIKKIVGCNFKRVYISNMDGVTIPKCKELTNDMINNMVLSYLQKIEGIFQNLCEKLKMYADTEQLEQIFCATTENAKNRYYDILEKEQLRISIENKEKEQKRQAKQATKQAKDIDTTTEEGVIQAQIIQAMMAGDFATLAELTNKLQTLQSK